MAHNQFFKVFVLFVVVCSAKNRNKILVQCSWHLEFCHVKKIECDGNDVQEDKYKVTLMIEQSATAPFLSVIFDYNYRSNTLLSMLGFCLSNVKFSVVIFTLVPLFFCVYKV